MTDLPEDRGAQLWERWTIDELFDQVARVLVCRSEPLPSHTTIIEILRATADPGTPASDATAELLRSAVAEAEIRGGDAWSDEEWSFIGAVRLAGFLEKRTGKPGLPRNRPLREGDVFLVVVDRGRLAADPLSEAGRSVTAVAEALAAYEAAGLEVFDVTAAARQSAKVVSDAAIRATASRPQHG